MPGFDFRLSRPGPGLGCSLARRPGVHVFDLTQGSLPAGLALMRASPGSAFAPAGALVSLGADAPRFDHDPASGALRGLLLEAAATNLVPQSIATVPGWIADSCSPQPLALNALGRFAGVSVPSSGVIWSRLKANVTLTAGTSYAVTCFLRAGSSGAARVVISGAGGETHVAGPVGAMAATRGDLGSCSDIRQALLADGLTWRVSFVFASAVAGAGHLGLGPASATAGADVILLAMQMEGGATPTSFIETQAAPGTRARDRLVLTGLSGPHDLMLDYAGGASATITGALLAPGYELTPSLPHLRRITAIRR